MAFPEVVSPRLASGALASANAHPISMPSSALTARGVLVVTTWDSAPTASTTSPGWGKIAEASAGPVGGALFYKRPGVTLAALTVDLSFAEEGTYIVLACDGAHPAEDVYAASSTGLVLDPDPPSLTPPGGIRDYLWIAAYGREAASSATAAPAGYTNLTTAVGGASGAGTQTAERTNAAASENPGPWTATAEDYVVWTIAIPPAPSAARVPDQRRRRFRPLLVR